MIKLAQHNLQKYGTRGAALSLPAVWLQDNNIKPGDIIPIYRVTDNNGTDLLIISRKELTANLTIEPSKDNISKKQG